MPGTDAQPIAVLDVGGTTLAAAVVCGDEVVGPIVRGSSHQAADADTIVAGLADAIIGAATGHDAGLAVIAMPAPFDYELGISHMTHKFAAIDGVGIGAALRRAVGLPVVFINDALAAALGAWVEVGRPSAPVAMVTLGTGVGSGLVIDGELGGHNELWSAPYLGGIVEDHVSSEALRADYRRRTGHGVSVAEVARMADAGDEVAIDTFATYGTHLGTAVAPYFADAGADTIAVAGGITGAWGHIEPAATGAFRAAGGTASLHRSVVDSPALLGGAEFGRRRLG